MRAERQTAGRGRQGRGWVSPPGNLYASTLVRLTRGEPPAPSLALVAAVALHEAVTAFGGDGVTIKWPNDLLIGGAKLSGILLERAGDAVVVGLGVNLAHHPHDLERPATSLAAAAGAAPDPDDFLLTLADSFARWLYRWRTEGLPAILGAWLDRAHPVGTALAVRVPVEAVPTLSPPPFVRSPVEGRAPSAAPEARTSTALGANGGEEADGNNHIIRGLFDGLDPLGALRLRLADGSSRVIHAADVFLLRD